MAHRQTELELMQHACKERFRGAQTGCCPYCGTSIKHDLARHVSSFHLDLGQLWRCPVSWCTQCRQWKGTPQDCVDHIRKTHYVNDSVKAANLWRWFPPWTVTRAAWHTALNAKVSGVSTDVALFSAHGFQLVHHYQVFKQCAAHASLRGSFIIDLRYFTTRACAAPSANLSVLSQYVTSLHCNPLSGDQLKFCR